MEKSKNLYSNPYDCVCHTKTWFILLTTLPSYTISEMGNGELEEKKLLGSGGYAIAKTDRARRE